MWMNKMYDKIMRIPVRVFAGIYFILLGVSVGYWSDRGVAAYMVKFFHWQSITTVYATIMISVGAILLYRTFTGKRALTEFIVGNRKTARQSGEILTAVIVPRRVEDAASVFLKLGARRYLVISISMVAAVVQADGAGRVVEARVAVGSCSVTARRLRELERNLVGRLAGAGLGQTLTAAHLADLSPINDVRATAEYRRDASLTLVRRAIEACVS